MSGIGADQQRLGLFLDALAAEQGAARNTLLAYGRDLRDFLDAMAAKDLSLDTLDRDAIETYLARCQAEGLAPRSLARRLSSIRQLTRFALQEGWRGDDPAQQITGPGRTKSLPDTLTENEISKLFEAIPASGRTDLDRARNRLVLELLYATGLRVSELVTLPVAECRGDPEMLIVRGKGGRERMVPLSPPAQDALADWLARRDAAPAGTPLGRAVRGKGARWLFASNAGAGHLTRQSVNTILRDLARAAGLDAARVSPHVIRHAFATHLLANGADLRVIQTLLGHADLGTTEIYTHVLDAHLRDLVFTHHPLARTTDSD